MDSVSRQLLASGAREVVGQQLFTASGTFIVPAGVTSISAVAVGRGANGTASLGGGGGALSYVNNASVTPGESLTVVIDTSVSRLHRSGTSLLLANACSGGVGANTAGAVGTAMFSGGNAGGNLGGGGAAGYSGNGGNGSANPGINGSNGAGGGGGGGGVDSGVLACGGGGGVGVFGSGANGTGGTSGGTLGGGGGGGSSGTSGANGSLSGGGTGGNGGTYGGGGGYGGYVGSTGGPGAVRIIWPGNLRQFPSTRTADE